MHDHKMETFVISTTIRLEELNLLLLPLSSHKPRLHRPRTYTHVLTRTHMPTTCWSAQVILL